MRPSVATFVAKRSTWKMEKYLLALSGALVFTLVYYTIDPAQATFRFGAMLPIYVRSSLSLFHFDLVFGLENTTRQCFFMNYIDHACIHKFLVNFTRFFKFM